VEKNPYKVLGVTPSASEEEIKTAYKSLVKKYHPDKYQATDLKELAEEKLSEVNVAYDTIMKQRASGNNNYSNNSSYSGYNTQQNYSYNRQNPYRQPNNSNIGANACDICSCLICSDCCCECCGGDLIGCC